MHPDLQNCWNDSDVNWDPLSETKVSGRPC